MTYVDKLLASSLLECVGWTLLHSLWQFTALGLLLWGMLNGMRSFSANARYVVSCIGLLTAFLCCSATFGILLSSSSSLLAVSEARTPDLRFVTEREPRDHKTKTRRETVLSALPDETILENELVREDAIVPPPSTPLPRNRLGTLLTPWLSRIAIGWIGGVVMLSLWNMVGLVRIRRIKQTGTEIASNEISRITGELMARLKVVRPVRILQSTLVEVPIVVGWLKPAIFLPMSLIMEMSAEQIQAILAHELAHVRRRDYLVNLFQTALETIFFYHPAVWWISGQIRDEREHCCDDEAVRACGGRIELSEALVLLAAKRVTTRPAVAATGRASSSPLYRVRRLLDPGSNVSYSPRASAAAALLVALSLPATFCCSGSFLAAQSHDGRLKDVDEQALSDAQVGQLISKLGAAEFESRQSAVLSLVRRGKPVIPAVSAAVLHENPEISRRALQVLLQLARSSDSETSAGARRAIVDLQDSDDPSVAKRAMEELDRFDQLQIERQRGILRQKARDGQVSEDQALSVLADLGATVRKLDAGISVQLEGDKWHGPAADLVFLKSLGELRVLNLGSIQATDAVLAMLGEVTSVRKLTLPKGVTDGDLKRLQSLTKLTHLSLGDTVDVHGRGLAYLADAHQLISLSLYGTRAKGEHLRHISSLRGLTSLTTPQSAMTDAGMPHIAQLAGLEELEMTNTGVTDAGFAYLSKLKNLERLNVSENPCLTDQALGHIRGLVKVDRLSLAFNNFTDACLPSLKTLSNVRDLSLDRTFISSTAVDELRATLRSTRISAAACMPLPSEQHRAAVNQLAQLGGRVRHLTRQTPIGEADFGTEVRLEEGWRGGDEDVRLLKELEHLEMLELRAFVGEMGAEQLGDLVCKRIFLRNPEVRDRDLRFLGEARTEMVWLEGPFSDDAIEILGNLNHLSLLHLRGTNITDNGLQALRQRLPNTSIRRVAPRG